MNVLMSFFDVLPSLRVIRKKDEGGGNVGSGGHHWLYIYICVYIYINIFLYIYML